MSLCCHEYSFWCQERLTRFVGQEQAGNNHDDDDDDGDYYYCELESWVVCLLGGLWYARLWSIRRSRYLGVE